MTFPKQERIADDLKSSYSMKWITCLTYSICLGHIYGEAEFDDLTGHMTWRGILGGFKGIALNQVYFISTNRK